MSTRATSTRTGPISRSSSTRNGTTRTCSPIGTRSSRRSKAGLRAPGWEARTIIVNVGDEGGRVLAERLADFGDRLTTFSAADDGAAADIRWRATEDGVAIEGLRTGPISSDLRLPGRHNASNAAAVAVAADRLGLDGRRDRPRAGVVRGRRPSARGHRASRTGSSSSTTTPTTPRRSARPSLRCASATAVGVCGRSTNP